MSDNVHTHAFWFYGVVVALAIDQAATPVIQHLIERPDASQPILLEASRLVVFLLIAVRFLLGAAVHFEEIRDADGRFNYQLDFLTGFVHFLLLFAWSFTVEVRVDVSYPISPYLLLLFSVLGYDLVWLAICRGKTTNRVRGWVFVNALTLLLVLLAFFVMKLAGAGREGIHYPVLVIVLLISLLDLGELTSGRRYIIPAVAGWLGFKGVESD